jgi:hypothetical protein
MMTNTQEEQDRLAELLREQTARDLEQLNRIAQEQLKRIEEVRNRK